MEHEFSPPQGPKHKIFINFRGHLRYGFISHVVDALRRNGIKVFIDKELNKGEDISNLLKRIEESRIVIVVFSNTYTESNWCLREAEKIMERVAQDMLQVLPIFYKVSTDDVKLLKGEFGNNFRDREREYRNNISVIEKWKEAIAFISHKFGLEVNEQSYESAIVTNIVNEVLRMLADIPSAEQNAKSQIDQVFEKGETSKNVASKDLEKAPRDRITSSPSAPKAAKVGNQRNVPPKHRHNQSHVETNDNSNTFSYSYSVRISPSQTSSSYNTTDHGSSTPTTTKKGTSHWFQTSEQSDEDSDF